MCGLNGFCEIKFGEEVCVCKKGFIGKNCQLNDPCDSKYSACNRVSFSQTSTSLFYIEYDSSILLDISPLLTPSSKDCFMSINSNYDLFRIEVVDLFIMFL